MVFSSLSVHGLILSLGLGVAVYLNQTPNVRLSPVLGGGVGIMSFALANVRFFRSSARAFGVHVRARARRGTNAK